MIPPVRRRFQSLGLGLAAAICGSVMRRVLFPVLGPLAPGVAFIPFIIGAAWFGGVEAGVIATLAGYAITRFVLGFTPPVGQLGSFIQPILFACSGWAISWLTDSLRQTKVRAEQDRRRAATILASVTDGLIGLNAEFEVGYQNAAAERLLGGVGRNALRDPLLSKLRPAMQQHARVSFEYRDSASSQWLEVHAYPDETGGLSVLLRDISERKQAEQTMAEANRALELSNAQLQQFAYVAAHDLSEPLRNLMSYSDLIANRYGEILGQEGREMLEVAAGGARRMQALVDDLLIYCRVVGQGEDRHKAVDCDAVLSFLHANFSQQLAECGGQITWGELPALRAPESQVMQLFQNLLSNALKYRGKKPPLVRISASHQNGEWMFSVQDNGIGIAPRYQEEIFGLFRRLHGRDVPGTGLGLAICKRIVEHHGGRIWVSAEEGIGSTFFFSFPDSRVEPAGTVGLEPVNQVSAEAERQV